ncbi:hypothetical protein GCM10010123_46500 [Pilimelia anulata]|uniref:PH domain-containing protein n=2 Tax=Pilimelia anulata TaxID=53371 RepID=A0A8J3BCD6_9ACTN|nr:hypothetical protein GCM10010123_46500 [Pilimelia anulata]
MRRSWRSWFWNVLLMLLTALMAAILTMVTFDHVSKGNWATVALFGVMSFIGWVGAVRALTIGVTTTPQKVVSRGFTKTTTIAWADVQAIVDPTESPGPAGTLGATAPSILRKRPGKPNDIVILDGLANYGIGRRRPSLGERAIADLNEHLSQWRRTHQPGG